ncbi:MAG: hypothetical protein E7Z93_06585 [Cyanobacteria bacterium SIG32]|nr:hypothetical protein [Cyanobacteria bacterium SIG32]
MVDNRSAGFFGIGGAFNFKSGDISGTAARTQDDKMGQGGEYFAQPDKDEDDNSQPMNRYMDQSAVLRATLNSLAMMNVANVINSKKRKITLFDEEDIEDKMKKLEESLTLNSDIEDEDFY